VPLAASRPAAPSHGRTGSNKLGAFLCWAVVFADIGTSVYYTPGILYSQVGRLAGLFVIMTLVVFLLLTLKYAEVSVRFPEGGGVVTVAAHGLNPWAGAVGGMFILVDYFLTSAISSLSGLQYLQTVIPAIAPKVLLITVIVVILLGLLNWYGIKESAIFSAAIAVAAFVSDMLILLVVFLHVPLSIIGLVFHEMFSAHHLGLPTILTGFAGAFLAFSGLESISQLSPVMKTPRKRTVTWALALVVITVSLTSPLLTVFSTTLLTDPVILHATSASAAAQAGTPDTTRFISELAQAYGGDVLAILTAITASTLLVFASNTAIIGAYHVFLALARMQFFPKIVEMRNRLRGTPHVSIALATGIPILVLIAVRGDINTLGDMYAFGLLGAFSLTCLSLDVLRFRERRGEIISTYTHPGDEDNEEGDSTEVIAALRARVAVLGAWVAALRARVVAFVRARTGPETQQRLRQVYLRVEATRSIVVERARPVFADLLALWLTALSALRQRWPDIKYYLGFLTTFLVGIAWITNLKTKPLATAFGGGITLFGLGIIVVHYYYQQRSGRVPVFLTSSLRVLPDSLMVVLTSTTEHNPQVIHAAAESAGGRPLVFLYLGRPVDRPVEQLEVNDPYLFDQSAQQTLSMAAGAARHYELPSQYAYRTESPNAVLDAWTALQPREIVAEADVAKAISNTVAPQYIRFQQVDGVRVAHYVRRHIEALK
jgi:amino acid transporter